MTSAALILTYVIAVFLIGVGLGLGATLGVKEIKTAFHTPKGIIIGWLSQFGFMPLFCFFWAKVIDFEPEIAIGLILVGCSPGGTSSNLFTYWSNGNVALSLVMSFASTIMALGMMPLLIFLYIEQGGLADDVKVDYTRIVITLILLVIPTSAGVYTKCKSDMWAKRLEKAAGVMGVVFLIVAFIFAVVELQDFFNAGSAEFGVAATLEVFGAMFGYGVAHLSGLHPRECRTIALETGVQNTALTIAIVALSYGDDETTMNKVIIFPLLYSFFYIINSAWLTYFFRYLSKFDPEEPAQAQESDLESGTTDSVQAIKEELRAEAQVAAASPAIKYTPAVVSNDVTVAPVQNTQVNATVADATQAPAAEPTQPTPVVVEATPVVVEAVTPSVTA
eukprot:GFYU01000390.1.p1 GENE.GFYU01000390.1~~GFYU01000390.1.p1  ORF type:complete len:392 (+),score=132.64 GFYU01000390.1:114-1289(+)